MTIITVNADRTRDTVVLSIDPAVMRVYEARAADLGIDVGELIEGLLADWPAPGSPAIHVDDVTPLIPPNATRRYSLAPTEQVDEIQDDDVKFVGGW